MRVLCENCDLLSEDFEHCTFYEVALQLQNGNAVRCEECKEEEEKWRKKANEGI